MSRTFAPQQKPAPTDLTASLLQALPHGVFLLAGDGAVLWQNDAARAMTAAGGQDLLPAQTPLARAFDDVQARGVTLTLHGQPLCGIDCLTVTLQPADGGVMLVAVPAGLVGDTAGEGARAALRPAALMARILAHEIKNPLAGIQAAGQLLARSVDAAGAELTTLIVREADRIRRLVDQVMIFDAETALALQPLNLHEPLEQALAGLAAEGLAIERRFDPSLPDIMGDHDRLVQVFINLARNAAEAGAKKLTVTTSYAAMPPLDAARQTRLPVTVTFDDDGAGMDAQTQARLFEAYYTTKESGQGLGLAVVAKIIDDHHARIAVKSATGRTVFTLSFAHPKEVSP